MIANWRIRVETDEIRQLIDNLGNADADVGMDAIDRLTTLGAEAVDPLLEIVVHRRVSRKDPTIIRLHRSWSEAVLILGQIGDPCVVEPLLAVYHDLCARGWPNPYSWGARAALVHALAQIGDIRAQPLLEQVAANDAITSIRDDATEFLKKLRHAI